MRALLNWLDDRTGYRRLVKGALYESIPGGPRWRYVWGSTLTFALGVQFLTGLVLWAAYSPNALGAWESVYFIQNHMWGGWLLRGIHHYTAQVTIVLLVLHLMQVVVDGAYKAPREVNFWFGLGLLFLVLGLSLTGYLLPWDQKGYWATKVATSIAAISPVIGPALQQLLVGGADYGHYTLTRFFALHAGLLPALVIVLVVGHIYLFRRHGITAKEPEKRKDGFFWPEQVLRDSVASLAVMATVLGLVLWTGGAHLGAPADPTEPYAAARPEWYFMFLFQWLKYFPAGMEVLGAIVIPTLVVGIVALMPFVGKWSLGHRFNIGMVLSLLVGISLLTWQAYAQDGADEEFQAAAALAEQSAHRVAALASAPDGIPATGALALLRADPETQGPRLFAANCASCHTYQGHDGLGNESQEEPTASDLFRFASREWLEGLMDPERIATAEYFGGTDFARGRMVRYVTRGVAQFDDTEQEQLAKVLKALSAEAVLPSQAAMDESDRGDIEEGLALIQSESMRCTECHEFRGVVEERRGPILTGFGSPDWISTIIRNPAHPEYYGDRNDRMPAFGSDEVLTEQEIRLLVDWLRFDWYVPQDSPLP